MMVVSGLCAPYKGKEPRAGQNRRNSLRYAEKCRSRRGRKKKK